MALFRVAKASSYVADSNIFTSIADGNIGSAQSGTTTVTIAYDQSAHFVAVNKGTYNTVTFTNVTTIGKALGIKSDGTNEVLTPASAGVYDLTNYVSAIFTISVMSGAVTVTLS